MKHKKYIITILILFIPAMFFGAINNTVAMGIILVPSVFATVLLNMNELFDKLSIIKLKDIEFKFKNTIEKANATIDQLLKIQYTLTEISTETVYRAKLWGGMPVKIQLALFDRLYKIAKENGAKETIDIPLKTAYQRLLSESFAKIPENISHPKDKQMLSEIIRKIYYFKGDTDIIKDGQYIPSPQAIRDFVASNFQCDASQSEVILGINEYEITLNTYQDRYGMLELRNKIST